MSNSVLIVDDEPRITAALMIRLEASGFRVFHAINGLAGVEAACLHKPDVIVMDVRMPDIDGYEACARIKRMEDLRDTPVLFLTAQVQDHARLKAESSGAFGYIAKPYEASDVIDAIHAALQVVPERVVEEGSSHG
ncbi:MAG: response regulator transcription factor [Phycisphaerales bacterium JB059]